MALMRTPSRSLAVGSARSLGPLNLAADQRAGFEHALVAECRFLVRFLGGQPVSRGAWIALIDVILCAHCYFNPACVLWTAHPPLALVPLAVVQVAVLSVE